MIECSSGKVVYFTRIFAKKVARKIKTNGKGKMYSRKLRPYQCRICEQWHLTKSASLPGNSLVEK